MCETSDKKPISRGPTYEQDGKLESSHDQSAILTELFQESYDLDNLSESIKYNCESKDHQETKKICIGKIWEGVGVIVGVCQLYMCCYPVHSQKEIPNNNKNIVNVVFSFFLIVNTIREAMLRSITFDKKRNKRRRKKERNAMVTVRKTNFPKMNRHFTISFIYFFLIGALLLPIFESDESYELNYSQKYSKIKLTKNNAMSNENITILSVLDIHLMYLFACSKKVIGSYIRVKAKKLAIMISKHTAIFTFRNPLRLRFRLQQLCTIIRLAKFLPQLVGTCNKLNGHVQDFLSKWRQRRRKQKVDKAWCTLMKSVKQKQRLEKIVRKIQYDFRRRREIKSMKLLAHMKSRPRKATEIFQRIEERVNRRIEHSRQVMKLSDQSNWERLQQSKVTYSDKRRLQKHNKKMLATQRQLLLAPDTTFSVSWKIIAISCVIFDVLHIAISPYISGKMDKIRLDKIFEKLFLPKEDICHTSETNGSRNLFSLLFTINTNKRTLSSECLTPFMERRKFFITVISKFLNWFLYTVSFLDVFVTFYTGEYQNKCGIVLHPKPFFARWILPGIGLQLAVNPSMHHACSLIKTSISFCIENGPSKTFHIIFLIWPLLIAIYHISVEILNRGVKRENSNINAKFK